HGPAGNGHVHPDRRRSTTMAATTPVSELQLSSTDVIGVLTPGSPALALLLVDLGRSALARLTFR
ncbi:MAG: hypothetical protein ACJ72D_14310, partial [Marmoricola sp.]